LGGDAGGHEGEDSGELHFERRWRWCWWWICLILVLGDGR
jgi:hypothetical protein